MLAAFKSLGEIILDDEIADVELRPRLFDEIPCDKLAVQIEALDDLGERQKKRRLLWRDQPFQRVVPRLVAYRKISLILTEMEGAHPQLLLDNYVHYVQGIWKMHLFGR